MSYIGLFGEFASYDEYVRAFEERFPIARYREREAAIDARRRRNVGEALASACWWSWVCQCERYEPMAFMFTVVPSKKGCATCARWYQGEKPEGPRAMFGVCGSAVNQFDVNEDTMVYVDDGPYGEGAGNVWTRADFSCKAYEKKP